MTFSQFIAILRARFWSALLVFIVTVATTVGVSMVLAKKDTSASVMGSEPARAWIAGVASHAEVAPRANL